MLLSGFLIVVLVGVASGDGCCGCWDRCFPQGLDNDSQLFLSVINSLRGLTIALNIKGSNYMMDGTATDANVFEYQKRVAALISLTQKINTNCPSNCCNQFITTVYLDYVAYFDWDTECLDKCDAAQALLDMVHMNQTSLNWVGGSCWLGDQTDGIPCQVSPKNRLAIAFMNNGDQNDSLLGQSFCTDSLYAARVAIKTGPNSDSYMSPLGYLKPPSSDPSTSLEFDLSYTDDRLTTVTNLLRCVRDRSCETPHRRKSNPKNRQTSEGSKHICYILPWGEPFSKDYASVDEFSKDAEQISHNLGEAIGSLMAGDPAMSKIAF